MSIKLAKHHTDFFIEDVIAALKRVKDDDDNPLFKTVRFLSEQRPEDNSTDITKGFLSPNPDDCPCAIVVYDTPNDTLQPATLGFYAEIFARASYYIVHFAANSPEVAPNLMLDRMMFRSWDYLDEPTDDNTNGIVPSSTDSGRHHWEYKTNESPRPQYENVTEIRGTKVIIPIEASSGLWARRIQIPPAQIIPNRPLT